MSPLPAVAKPQTFVRHFDTLTNEDVALVGGKNASLGEMIGTLKSEGIRVPDGFATTSIAYRRYLDANDLEQKIHEQLKKYRKDQTSLSKSGAAIRRMIRNGKWPDDIALGISDAYRDLCRREGEQEISVAVRSSATAEDLPDASFAEVDYLTPNESEAAALVGHPVENADQARDAARALRERGVTHALITLGADGVYVSSPDYEGHIPAVDAGPVIETTGAGDAFNGALAAAIAEDPEAVAAFVRRLDDVNELLDVLALATEAADDEMVSSVAGTAGSLGELADEAAELLRSFFARRR